ncbi:MAG TPA: hypothetical protein P5572_18495 [Phycisphaerae bacterium]|nr:hypothetical protein [Phycisphaerae bacterium]
MEPNEDGSSTITCIQVNADGSSSSTAVTVRNGSPTACTVADVPQGAQISCDDGTNVIVTDGTNGTDGSGCSVTDNPDGSATITCTDGTSATVPAGEDGRNGTNGSNGSNGRDGESCDVTETATQVCITCGEDEVCIDKNENLPLFDTVFIDAFYTVTGGSIAAARQADAFDPIDVFEPKLNCEAETVAYKMGVPQRYNMSGAGNPITMRLYLYRTGPTDGDCMVLRLDSFRAQRNQRIETYGGTRYLNLDLSGLTLQDDQLEGLLIVDLPLNNGSDFAHSLAFPTPNAADLLAFELNVLDVDRFNDGGCYSLLGVDFFESAAGDASVDVAGVKEITDDADTVMSCGHCAVTDHFDQPDSNDVPGYETHEADPDDVAIVSDMLQLRDDGDPNDDPNVPQTEAQAIKYDIDVSNYSDLTLTVKWSSLGGSSNFDHFYVQWRPCSNDTPIPTNSEVGEAAFLGAFSMPLLVNRQLIAGPFFPASEVLSVPLPQAAVDAGCIDLRFFTVVSQATEGALVDYYELCGTPREPEPRWACVEDACVEDVEGQYASFEDCSSNCVPPMRYACVENACVENVEGEYDTFEDCSSNCVPPTRYACVEDACVEDLKGEYATFEDCSSNCVPQVRYNCSQPAEAGVIGQCVEALDGAFASLEECQTQCAEPRYSCAYDSNGGYCVLDAQGPYTEADCLNDVCNDVPLDRAPAATISQ